MSNENDWQDATIRRELEVKRTFILREIMLAFVCVGLLFPQSSNAQPVTIDDFTTTAHSFIQDNTTSDPQEEFSNGSGIEGGQRELLVDMEAGDFMSGGVSSGEFKIVMGGADSGRASVTWDGQDEDVQTEAFSLLGPMGNLTGLNDRDITQMGTLNGFRVQIKTCDLACNDTSTLTLTVYSNSNDFSTLTTGITLVTPPSGSGDAIYDIPFTNFTDTTGAGADFENVRAIVMDIENLRRDGDVGVSSLQAKALLETTMTATPDPASENDIITYTVQVINPNDQEDVSVPGTTFSVDLGGQFPPGSVLLGSGAMTSQGTITEGNVDVMIDVMTPVSVNIGTVTDNQTVTITFQVQLPPMIPPMTPNPSLQGFVSTTNGITNLRTDDPVEPGLVDPTVVGLEYCGNGDIEGDEYCDDGNVDDMDTCATNCTLGNDEVCTDSDACFSTHCDPIEDTCESLMVCGNGLVEPGEGCDDGRTNGISLPDDVCSDDCFIYTCSDINNEDCQPCSTDSNGETGVDSCFTQGDAVAATCTDPDGAGPLSGVCVEECGNGVVDMDEGCDPGALDPNVTCNPTTCLIVNCGSVGNAKCSSCTDDAQCEMGGTCKSDGNGGMVCVLPGCGNGVLEMGEGCDDGARDPIDIGGGDSCSEDCRIYTCDAVTENCEECNMDTDGTVGADSCDIPGRVTPVCEDPDGVGGSGPVCIIPGCGNGITEAGEGCDDGGTDDGDGCSAECKIEGCDTLGDSDCNSCDENDQCETDSFCHPGSPEPSVCLFPNCGNGVLEGGEGCDDGNTDDGDDCDSDCKIPACDKYSDANCWPCNTEAPGEMGVDSCGGSDAGEVDCLDDNAGGDAVCIIVGCGNELLESNEGCDDGNTDDGDDCNAICLIETVPGDPNQCNQDPVGATGDASCADNRCNDDNLCLPGSPEPAIGGSSVCSASSTGPGSGTSLALIILCLLWVRRRTLNQTSTR